MKNRLLFTCSALLLVGMLSGCNSGGGGTDDSDVSGHTDSGTVSHVSKSDGQESGGGQGGEQYEEIEFHGKLRVYYHNDAGNYANKCLWVWSNTVNPKVDFMFDNASSPDDYGVYKIFDLSVAPWKDVVLTSFNFIVKAPNTWTGQSTDTICPFGKFASNIEGDMMTIYACDGEGTDIDTFASKKEALGDRVASSYFTDWKTIHVVGGGAADGRPAADIGKVDTYELYAYDAKYLAMDVEQKAANKGKYRVDTGVTTAINKNEFDIKLPENAKPNLAYTVEAKFTADTSRTKSKITSFTKLFDDPGFNDYVYSGNDLGVTVDGDVFTFKLWAPTSSRVQVKIYASGTPGDLFSVLTPNANDGRLYDMELGNYGVWQIAIDDYMYMEDLVYYYTFLVTNSSGTNEVCDPYATATGLNGRRGAIIDWNRVEKPQGWDRIASGQLLTDISRPNELSVYEAHIRDLTADSTWNGQSLRGTYNAFVEEGTTYNGVTTGFDHIKELGCKAIQLLPVFGQDNDERWYGEDGKMLEYPNQYLAGEAKVAPAYNWGYNPLNFNAIEGGYSSNPTDALTVISEFRNLVQKCANNDIRVIMDVVYNHFASINGQPLTKIVPGYYLRALDDGSYYDGTGCGNVTASERPMMRKFVVDSVVTLAKNYKIKGFRFDLMGCLDVETMKQVKIALYDVDPDIVVYGEGWAGLGDGGFYACVNSKEAYKDLRRASLSGIYSHLSNIKNAQGVNVGSVGGFSNGFRNAVKGDVQDDIYPEWGYVSKGANDVNNDIKGRVGEGVLGANKWSYEDNCWWQDKDHHEGSSEGYNNEQTVSYVTCHDNYGLFDQLNYCIKGQDTADVDDGNADVLNAAVASQAAAVLNQGIAFLQGGDEIFRQKVMDKDDEMFDEMVESFHTETDGKNTWKVGDGIPMKSGKWLVRNAYKYGDAVNAFKWDRKVKYQSYFEQVKAAVALRNEEMGNMFGRAYSEIQDRGVNNVFGSTYGYTEDDVYHDTPHLQMVGCYMQGKKDSANYYIVFGGRLDTDWADLRCGKSRITVLYSSSKAHEAGDTFVMENETLGAGKFEYLVVKSTAI